MAITSSRSPCSPVAASLLCAVEHKTDYVAVLIMLRRLRLDAFPQTIDASRQHNVVTASGRLRDAP
jgi:hypothetical protein